MKNGIIILDFGSQYNQLIARRIREMEVYSEVIPYNTPLDEILAKEPAGIVLSGGPSSVNAENAHLLGGQVKKGVKGEYGKAKLQIDKSNEFLAGVSRFSTVWMSHFDEVQTVPAGFTVNATTDVISAISNEEKKIYCVQFHPEVSH